MANPGNPIDPTDIHFQDRGNDCFTLVDPTLDGGSRDVASTWCEARPHGEIWRWRMNDGSHDGTPYPTAISRDGAMEAMLNAYARDPEVAARIEAQRPRWSFGSIQIVRATRDT